MSEPHDPRRSAPAALRNREPIASVLREELPETGLVLEIASGTGEHVVHFARAFPRLEWQPSDIDPGALASIAARRDEVIRADEATNLLPPIALDMCGSPEPNTRPTAIVCINMVHISPPEASKGLLRLAGSLLPDSAPLILYGPYLRAGNPTVPSNLAFDISLKQRDSRWGLREVAWFDEQAARHSLRRTRLVEMPANNLMLIYRHSAGG